MQQPVVMRATACYLSSWAASACQKRLWRDDVRGQPICRLPHHSTRRVTKCPEQASVLQVVAMQTLRYVEQDLCMCICAPLSRTSNRQSHQFKRTSPKNTNAPIGLLLSFEAWALSSTVDSFMGIKFYFASIFGFNPKQTLPVARACHVYEPIH